jgi:hypothetical protein
LEIWYYTFNYKLLTRMDVVINHGVYFFVNQYIKNMEQFWLTPGIAFIIMYFLLVCYFVFFVKRYAFSFSLIIAIVLAYTSTFFTVDWTRVFPVCIISTYIYALIEFVTKMPNPSVNWTALNGTSGR